MQNVFSIVVVHTWYQPILSTNRFLEHPTDNDATLNSARHYFTLRW